MPNAINPEDYNIDKLNTKTLGPILTTDFRDHVLNNNLSYPNQQLEFYGYNIGGLNSFAGDLGLPYTNIPNLPNVTTTANIPLNSLNNLSPYESNQVMNLWLGLNPYTYNLGGNTIQTSSPQPKKSYVDTTKKLGEVGNTKSWKSGSGEIKTSKSVVDGLVNNNTYGPSNFIDITNLDEIGPDTGFNEYKTFAGGDFRSSILGRQLGFGPGAGIEYESNLADIGKDQRKFNVKERIKLNFVDETVGRINLDPFGLLSGQDLFMKDYTITRPPGFGGKAASFTASLVGFNLPRSVIPQDANISVPGYSDTLLKYTSNGTKSLLYDAIILNKWGPKFGKGETATEPKTKVGKFISKVSNVINDIIDGFSGAGDQPTTISYTDPIITDIEEQTEREKPLVDKLNSGVKKLIDGLINKQKEPTIPTESIKPSILIDPTVNGNLGYNMGDGTYGSEYKNDDEFNKPGITPQYSTRFKTIQPNNTEPELTSDKNTLLWKPNNGNNTTKRGLLKFTQNLINDGGEDNSAGRYIGKANSDNNIDTNKNNRHKEWSQGNRVKSIDNSVYCRSWSVRNPYSKLEDTIRHESLRRADVFKTLSILEDNGMPKIVPYKEDYVSVDNPAKYMLSIENLAWQGTNELYALHKIERGPNGGRLMWFPPYDINFTDNTSVNWETTQFIGRAEPIYTYNNTERTGTLSFIVLTDSPSALEVIKEETQVSLERYFAGCELTNTAFGDISSKIVSRSSVEKDSNTDTSNKPTPFSPPPTITPQLTFYFENADTTAKPGRDIQTDIDSGYGYGNGSNTKNTLFLSDLDTIAKFLIGEEGKRYQIITHGYRSALNVNSYNKVLGLDRATSIKNYLQNKLIELDTSVRYGDGEKTYPTEAEWINNQLRWAPPSGKGEVGGSGQNTPLNGTETPEEIEVIINDPKAINARKASVTLIYNPNIDAFMREMSVNENEEIHKKKISEKKRREETIKIKSAELTKEMVNEATYFNKLKVEDSFVYDSLKDKVKFFHPAFHSMTPEGMNSRLTFLQQCTRQGPSINIKNGPNNMAFGKPPICVLRIGDFYHTKIVIDSVNFSYEPLQWDLNPEGIGVQPMLTKVDLNFKFIGGSSLGGPISQLQNAVSFNFFANTSVYNERRPIDVPKGTKLNGDDIESFNYGSYIRAPVEEKVKEKIKEAKPSEDEKTKSDDVTNGQLTFTQNYELIRTDYKSALKATVEVGAFAYPKDNLVRISKYKVWNNSTIPTKQIDNFNNLIYDCSKPLVVTLNDGTNIVEQKNPDLTTLLNKVFCKGTTLNSFDDINKNINELG